MYQNIFITSRTENDPATVYLWDDKKGLSTMPYKEFDYAYKIDSKGQYMSMYGQSLKKIRRWKRDDVSVFESDVGRETRVLTDLYLDSDDISSNHIIGAFDIEVSSVGGFPDVEKADKEILSIAFFHANKGYYVTFLLDPTNRVENSVVEKWDGEHPLLIRRYDTEEEMLTAFLTWYANQLFTILTGWHLVNFDIPYLYRRMAIILDELSASMLSPIGIVKWKPRRERYQIAGVSCLDYLEMYKKFTYISRPSYRLDAIAEYELGEKKVDLGMTIDDMYDSDINTFIEYNATDVMLVVHLDRKLKLIELVRGICHVGHVPYEDYTYSSKFIEGTIIAYLHRKGIICSNKPVDGQEHMSERDESGEEGFEGAYVKEPKPGLYQWVYSLDLQSLYPSIIMSLNISPETKIGYIKDWDVEGYVRDKSIEYEVIIQNTTLHLTGTDLAKYLNEHHLAVSSNGILYDTSKTGIIPEILDKWFSERAEYKSLMKKYANEGNTELERYYDKRQHIQKIFLNSIYGVLGLPIFRFYDLDNALAVTATGQDVIKTSARFVNSFYTTDASEDHCIYIDTDSVYFSAIPLMDVSSRGMEKDKTIDIATTMENRLNEFYDIMAGKMFFIHKHRFVIKGETIARSGLWIAKKRYAMKKIYDLETQLDVDKIVVKGIDVVRSSFPIAFGKFLSNTLSDILNGIEKENLDSKLLDFYNSLSSLSHFEISRNTSVKGISKYDERGSTALQKFKKGTPIHVKAALAYNRLLQRNGWDKRHALIRDGDKIKYTYLKQNPYYIETIAFKGFDDPPEIIEFITEYIDPQQLYEAELKKKLEDIYNAVGWGTLPTNVNQVANQFFSF